MSRCSSERLMKKERNCTNFEIRMPMFGSPALPTHKVAERVEVVLRIPSFSLLASWGEVFSAFCWAQRQPFSNAAFPRSGRQPPFAVGLERCQAEAVQASFFTNFTWSAGTSERSGESSRRSSHFGHLSFLDKIPRLRLLATGAPRRPR